MRAFGLKTWIWNNGWKTALLLAGFPFLLLLLSYAARVMYLPISLLILSAAMRLRKARFGEPV